MMGDIDDMHIAIAKSSCAFVEDYFHHKTRGYNIVAQMVVDNQIFFIDVYVRLLGSVNDSHVLRKFGLYYCALHGGLFDMVASSQDRLLLYLLEDKGYPLFFWFMISQKEYGEHHLV
jgi:hypothetical protein